MYLGMDGTGVPMRLSELEGRAGKQPDGSAKTREVKLVTVWSAEGRDDKGIPVRDPGSVTYSAAIESAAGRDTDKEVPEFAKRAAREATRRGFDQARRRVVLGDGAPWIWNLADEQFPGAVQIVDLYHAKGHLWDVAKAIYGAGSDRASQWAKQQRDELDEGKIDALLAALRVHAQANDEARKCLDYVARNHSRMRYPEFRAQGLCVSSGVVEAGCKVAIGTRLKRAGCHRDLDTGRQLTRHGDPPPLLSYGSKAAGRICPNLFASTLPCQTDRRAPTRCAMDLRRAGGNPPWG